LQAFEAAWVAACKIEASVMLVPPEYTYLVGPISFSGPYCQANIVFQVRIDLFYIEVYHFGENILSFVVNYAA